MTNPPDMQGWPEAPPPGTIPPPGAFLPPGAIPPPAVPPPPPSREAWRPPPSRGAAILYAPEAWVSGAKPGPGPAAGRDPRRIGPAAIMVSGFVIIVLAFFAPWIVVSGSATFSGGVLVFGAWQVAVGLTLALGILAAGYAVGWGWARPEYVLGVGVLSFVASLTDLYRAMHFLALGQGYLTFNKLWDSPMYGPMHLGLGVGPIAEIAGVVLLLAGAAWGLALSFQGAGDPAPVPVWVWAGPLAVIGLIGVLVLVLATPTDLPQSFYFNVPGRHPVAQTPAPVLSPSPLAPSAVPPTAPPVATPLGPDATSYQENAAHDGNATGAHVRLPVSRAWTHSFDGTVGYPLVVGGQVFVPVAPNPEEMSVVALDGHDGHIRWKHTQATEWGYLGLASDSGRVFTVSAGGEVSAYGAGTGALEWTTKLDGQYMFRSPPTAVGGTLYVVGAGGGATLYAVDERTGTVTKDVAVDGDDYSAPTVGGSNVYVGLLCADADAYSSDLGQPAWPAGRCSGVSGRTVAWNDGRLYVRTQGSTQGAILDGTTGKPVGRFISSQIPAFGADRAYFVEGGMLVARNLSMQEVWPFNPTSPIVSAPIVLGRFVCAVSVDGHLYVVDDQGRAAETFRLPEAPSEGFWQDDLSTIGMNAGDGVLVVANGHHLLAFR